MSTDNKDNIIIPLLIKLGLTHQKVTLSKSLKCRLQLAVNHQVGWLELSQM